MTEDYRKRYQAAIALLTDIYAADVVTASALSGNSRDIASHKGSSAIELSCAKDPAGEHESKRARGFEVYDKALLSLLKSLSGSLEETWRQKLFTQTLLDCPRVPQAALEMVCGLCEAVSRPHDLHTGELCLYTIL